MQILILVDVWQVWNSSSYCSNTSIYTCIRESSSNFITWDIYENRISIIHVVLSRLTTTTVIKNSGSLVATAVINHISINSITSTITITNNDPLNPRHYSVDCSGNSAEDIPRTSISSKCL